MPGIVIGSWNLGVKCVDEEMTCRFTFQQGIQHTNNIYNNIIYTIM
jgi:hypothetical protein